MEKKKIFFYITLAILGVIPIVEMSSKPTIETNAMSKSKYVCGSIHLGMSDDTLQAKTYNTSAGFCFLTKLNSVWDNIEITSSSGVGCSNNSTKKRPVKIGLGSSAALNIMMNKSVIGITVYAFSNTDNDFKVNDKSLPIPKENISIGVNSNKIITYTPYYVPLESTDTLTFSLNKGNVFISDIALRII